MSERIAVSSWALHWTLGISYPDSPGKPRALDAAEGILHSETSLPLCDLPRALAHHGYSVLQLCHFHLPSRAPGYLEGFRRALADASVTLHALLIDEGDVTDPEHGERDAAWIKGWLDVAESLGAQHARVIAGKQPASPSTLAASAEALGALSVSTSVRLQTENWFALLSEPSAVNELLDCLDGRLGLCADFGNWPRPRKYEDLPKIMARAEACHAKFEFVTADTLDELDADACLGIARNAVFAGTYVLVNGGIGESEWDALAVQREALLREAL